MKSEHRHELKTNELAEWLGNFPQWAQDNLKTIIYVAVLIVVVAGLYFYKWYSKNVESVKKQVAFTRLISVMPQQKMQILGAQQQDEDLSFLLLRPANDLKTLADNTKNKYMAALALLKQAETFRIELHYRLESATKEEAETQLNKAKKSYTDAFNLASKSPALQARAKLGQGLCEEELGNFPAAEDIYHELAENPSFEGTTAAAIANYRLAIMDDYKQSVVFRTPKTITPPETVQPLSEIAGPVITDYNQ